MRGEMTAQGETLRSLMEERLLVEIAASQGRLRAEIEDLAGMTQRDDHRAAEKLQKELQEIRLRVEKLEAAVFAK